MNSIGIFVGNGSCNAKCKHCAGIPLRGNCINPGVIEKTLIDAYNSGTTNLTISSAGEPTLFPGQINTVLDIVNKNQLFFKNINLYTNGILIGKDIRYIDYLKEWRSKGLNNIYLTVHSVNTIKNAQIYGVKNYPEIKTIIKRVKSIGINVRANLILGKSFMRSFLKFIMTCEYLMEMGVSKIAAWPVRNADDSIKLEELPNENELYKIEKWANSKLNVTVIIKDDRKAYNSKEKLTLFPNGVLSNKWC